MSIKLEMFGDMSSIVVDIGTWKTRLGYGGDDAPRFAVSSFLTRPTGMEIESHKYLPGDKQLYRNRENCAIDSIFSCKGQAYVFDKQKLQCFLQSLLVHDLQLNVPDYSLLFSEDIAAKPHEMKQIRDIISELIFEKLGASNIYFLKAPVLCCFATGRSTATVLDSGDTYTRTSIVHDGFCLTKTAKVVVEGGRALSLSIQNYIQKKIKTPLANRYHQEQKSYQHFHNSLLLSDIKETLSGGRGEDGDSQPNWVDFQLPDKQMIRLERQELKQIAGQGVIGDMPRMLGQTIEGSDVDIKKQLYGNILLAGGNTLYDGVTEDVLGGLTRFSPPNVRIKQVTVCTSSERKHLAWIGGSVVTSLSSFQSYWVGGQEWKELRSSILDKKCV